MSISHRAATLLAIILPFVGLIAAMILAWDRGFDWIQLALLFGMYVVTGLGITVGFHRFFAHKSFSTNRYVQAALAVMGSMACEGPLLRWVAYHRSHHQHSDGEEDPHTPHGHGHGMVALVKGFWKAHIGWLFDPASRSLGKYVKDLKRDKFVRRMSALFPLWVLLGLLIPTVLGGLLTMSWTGAGLGLLWGGLVRIFLVHHVTWSINSVCHIWGSQPFRSHDESRNNPIFGILAFGEGWHNNHHAFPYSARHGLRWWQIDTSYIVIRVLSWFGLAWNIRVPSRERMMAKMR
ncbi:MAG: acyl-CoA desaturase [Phycisphaerales bacterium]